MNTGSTQLEMQWEFGSRKADDFRGSTCDAAEMVKKQDGMNPACVKQQRGG